MEDDILNWMNEPIPVTTTIPETKPVKKNNWDDIDIPPIKIDPTKLTKVRAYVMTYNTLSNIPADMINKMVSLGKLLSNNGYMLRNTADERDPLSIKLYNTSDINKTIFIPWKTKNSTILGTPPGDIGYGYAAYYHKGFKKISPHVRAIVARDAHLVTGSDGISAAKVIIVYHPSGAESIGKTDYKILGTLVVLYNMALDANIPIFNLYNPGALAKLLQHLNISITPNTTTKENDETNI